MTTVPPDVAFPFIGGHPALDLLNTVRWRLDGARRVDDLHTYGHLLAWATQAALIAEREHRALLRRAEDEPQQAHSELVDVRALRETAHAALMHHDLDAVADLDRRHRDALDRVRLTRTGSHWSWSEPEFTLSIPRDRATRAVVDLLTSPRLAALHQCEDAACGWVYLDTSPRHNRRWCVASDCGNRNRARRFYARHRGPATPTTGAEARG